MKLKIYTSKDKYKLIAYAVVGFIICYMLPNHFGFFEPHLLKMYEFEKLIPFIDWTIWIYMSDYVYVVLAFLLLKDNKNINRIYYAFILFYLLSMIVFYIFPTTFPRPNIEYTGVNGFMFSFLHSIDTPSNCLPSLHVGMSFLLSFAFLYEQKKYFALFFVWAILISISTLTTKQHYFIDIFAGLFLCLICLFISDKFFKNKNV